MTAMGLGLDVRYFDLEVVLFCEHNYELMVYNKTVGNRVWRYCANVRMFTKKISLEKKDIGSLFGIFSCFLENIRR